MEIEENHRNHKRSRVGNGNQAAAKLDDDEDDGDQNKELSIINNNSSSNNRMRPWHHPSSRIFRVSRASGGKDRHSKVYTAKGLRDRRVRLSAAESAISELPSLDTTFPDSPLELQPLPSDSGIDPEADPSYNQQQHSSASETSKGWSKTYVETGIGNPLKELLIPRGQNCSTALD
ncbi:uncharacterized protein A4U43_C10F130 [Asparagus officinalis]|uniref:TCP domain-containing protein n=1 Tax=Asparagus officinalis TaxID=4686 RepID=A0A5P1DZJ7_ASPOF|nr:uncharacterized protein A4U43_C10F130 [Asparagus officinalis]